MYTLRCTQKLQRVLHVKPSATLPPTTTRLGDWYGNTIRVGRQPLIGTPYLCDTTHDVYPFEEIRKTFGLPKMRPPWRDEPAHFPLIPGFADSRMVH